MNNALIAKCIKCGNRLTDDNWYPSWKRIGAYECKRCVSKTRTDYERKRTEEKAPLEPISVDAKCSHCGAPMTEKNWFPSLRRRKARICKTCYYKYAKAHRGNVNKELQRAYRAYQQTMLKFKVIAHYSPKIRCQKCGYDEFEALCIDHVDGGGNRHRKRITKGPGGIAFYMWLIRNDFPSSFQVLCFNCNHIKSVTSDMTRSPYIDCEWTLRRKNLLEALQKRRELHTTTK